MPKPLSKQQLLQDAETERAALDEFLAGLTPDQLTQAGALGDWSAKDVMAHLLEWEGMVLHWYQAGTKGQTPITPSEEYNWGQLPQLNQAIYLKHCDRPLAEVQQEYQASYKKVMKTLRAIPEAELFTRGQFAWTRNNLLAAYFTSCTSSHYRWARTGLRKAFKAQQVK